MINSPTAREKPQPTWEITHLFPNQGHWHEAEYLAMESNHMVEFSGGYLEVLSIPTPKHQTLVAYLYGLFLLFVRKHQAGKVLFAPLEVQLWQGKYREPDIMFLSKEHLAAEKERYWRGADLVLEVVSGSSEDRVRDLVLKRQEYAQAGVPEYWIVDPQMKQITVLTLDQDSYVDHGIFTPGEDASSVLLPGFRVDVTDAFAAANQ
ncbi:MAG: Uma2 family endonuclease [Anaerolineae bacterium]|nr:Uma2 family endonuclease [Anaerolineae bacterium]